MAEAKCSGTIAPLFISSNSPSTGDQNQDLQSVWISTCEFILMELLTCHLRCNTYDFPLDLKAAIYSVQNNDQYIHKCGSLGKSWWTSWQFLSSGIVIASCRKVSPICYILDSRCVYHWKRLQFYSKLHADCIFLCVRKTNTLTMAHIFIDLSRTKKTPFMPFADIHLISLLAQEFHLWWLKCTVCCLLESKLFVCCLCGLRKSIAAIPLLK